MIRILRSQRLPILAALVLATVLGLGSATAAFKYIEEGMRPPAIVGTDLATGEAFEWRPVDGEVAAIVFWATWSPRSLQLLRDLAELQESLADAPFKVVAVNVDGQHTSPRSLEEVKAAVAEIAPPFGIVVDRELETFYAYGVIAVPSVALVDEAGVLRFAPSGYSITIRDTIARATRILLGDEDVQPLETPLVRGHRPADRASRYYGLAVRMASKGHDERALENLESAVASDSLFASPWILRGELALRAGDPASAVASFSHAASLDGNSVAALAGWGRALLRSGMAAEAEQQLQAAVDQDAAYTPALADLGSCAADKGDTARAIEYFEEALALDSRDPDLLYRYGRLRLAAGDTAAGVAAFRSAVELLVDLPVGVGR